MYRSAIIAIVVPAFDEARSIGRVLARLPAFVDRVYVVDDASRDGTSEVVRSHADPRVTCLRHERNQGVGAAIVTGYGAALAGAADVLVVMAGDDQMHPDDLEALLEPIVNGRADYVKGNRFRHALKSDMPLARRSAGRVLAWLTRLTTGLAVDDSQCGYTALGANAARRLPLSELWPRYGYPNDLLGLLAQHGFRVAEVPVRPIYAGERSGVRPWHALSVTGVIFRRYWLGRKLRRDRTFYDLRREAQRVLEIEASVELTRQ